MESKSLSSNESDRDLGGSSDHSGDEFNTEIAALREKLSKAKQEKMELRNGVVSLFQQLDALLEEQARLRQALLLGMLAAVYAGQQKQQANVAPGTQHLPQDALLRGLLGMQPLLRNQPGTRPPTPSRSSDTHQDASPPGPCK